MKTFSLFSPKGGCGKTTLTILFASYLHYKKGKSVKVNDYEATKYPCMRFREADQEALRQAGSPLYNYLKDRDVLEPYPIECLGKEINTYEADDILKIARAVNEEIRQDKFDYLLLDFPGGYSRFTPISCLMHNHLLDGVYIPSSTEREERINAYEIGRHFLEEGQPFRIVWNKLKKKYIEKPSLLDMAEEELLGYDLTCSKVRIKAYNKNTLCWPDRYVQMYCPELIDLFEEIISFLGD